MKQIQYSIALLMLLAYLPLHAVAPFIQPRSQSEDSARELVGWTRYINLYDQEEFYGSLACTLEYSQSIRPENISFNLFGSDLIDDVEPFIKISGSQVGDREATDWLADYFGLPTDFESKIFFNPQVSNIIFDINLYLGLDQWLDGLYFRIHAPIVNARWNLRFTENIINPGINGYDAGYFGPVAVPRNQLVNNFTDFVSNMKVPNLGGVVTFTPLKNAKMSTKKLTKTGVSDIQAAFGWNFLQSEGHHFGLNIRAAAPTGNRPEGVFLFEPMIGNGKHWELGLGLTCHYLLFVDECRPRSVAFYCDANLTYLFRTMQRRTFDLVGKPMSRYMLLEKIGTPVENLFINTSQGTAADSVAPTNQFQNLYIPVANLTTFDIDVSVASQFDLTAMIDISWGNWNFDFGYNYWARSCENIEPNCQCSLPFNSNNSMYALKGDARTYGFVAQDAVTSPLPPGTPIPLSATENAATINSGTNRQIGQPVAASQNQNPGIDGGMNQWAMVDTESDADQIVVFPGEDGGADTQQRSSLAPIFLQPINIDIEAAEIKGLSNRLFAHVSYNWDNCPCNVSAFAGLGGFVELAHHRGLGDCADPDFDESCQSVAFSQWGIWIKAGIGF